MCNDREVVLHGLNDSFLFGKWRQWKLDENESLRRHVSNTRGDIGTLPKPTAVKISPEDCEGIARSYSVVRSEAKKRLLVASTRYLVAIHRRPSNELGTLPLVEENVAEAELVSGELLWREVHPLDISNDDSIFKDVCNPQIWTHVVARMMLRCALPA